MQITDDGGDQAGTGVNLPVTARVARKQFRATGSPGKDFIADKMQADDLRPGGMVVKVAIHRFLDARPQQFHRFCSEIDPDVVRQCHITTAHFVLTDFKNDFGHTQKIIDLSGPGCKPHKLEPGNRI